MAAFAKKGKKSGGEGEEFAPPRFGRVKANLRMVSLL